MATQTQRRQPIRAKGGSEMAPKANKVRKGRSVPAAVEPLPEVSPMLPSCAWIDSLPAAQPSAKPTQKSRQMSLQVRPGETVDGVKAAMVVRGLAGNATATAIFQHDDHGDLSLDALIDSLQAHGRDVNRGDLAGLEQMLAAQSVTLNAIFTQLARRACLNMDSSRHLGAGEIYLRLALKAQSQCRATAESLAAIKSPPVVIAKQMNVANGPQQVNNGKAVGAANPAAKSIGAERTESRTNHGKAKLD